MKKFFIALPLLVLTGCAGNLPAPTGESDLAIAQAMKSCYEGRAATERSVLEKLESPEQATLFYTVKALAAASGAEDECGNLKTSLDAYIEYQREYTKRVASISGMSKSLFGNVVTAALGWKGLDTLGDVLSAPNYSLSAGGDLNLSKSLNNYNLGGDGVFQDVALDLDIPASE